MREERVAYFEMLHAECTPKYFENHNDLEAEPSSKRMKSTEEPYGKSYEGLQRFHEEIHIKKTHSGFIPLSLSDDEEEMEAKQEKNNAEVVNPFNKALSGKTSSSIESSDLVKKAEITESKCSITYSTDVANNGGENNLVRKHKNKVYTELYSTSKAFIGPIYKSEADRQHNQNIKYIDKNYPAGSNTLLGRNCKKKITQTASGDVPKLEDELLQFYSEIDQLESNNSLDDHLQGTEASLPWQPKEYNKFHQTGYINSQEWSYETSLKGKEGQCFYKESSGHSTDNKKYSFNDPSGHRTDKEENCHNGRNIWEAEQPCNKHKDSRFWYDSESHFRHSWQPTHSFIIPYRSSPQLTAHFNFQGSKSFSLCSDSFKFSDVEQLKRINFIKNGSIYDQSNKYSNYPGIHSMQTIKNECNVPEGCMIKGFCETQTNWVDNRTYRFEGSNTVPQQYAEDNICEFKKRLLILRGLPGSGKTTLSHILLGQSQNGIVFSTDDYFRQINGCWMYDVTQLGAAHEWNQNRARDAMDLGRSPVIIDNTNTQAWEMKPYVEAALEKGYHVEFHEPDTWWKFIPKELEKRNEHGVSHEKIVQMLERYEFQISIPIVMNSMLPFPQTSKRPYSQKRQRWGDCSVSWNNFSVSHNSGFI